MAVLGYGGLLYKGGWSISSSQRAGQEVRGLNWVRVIRHWSRWLRKLRKPCRAGEPKSCVCWFREWLDPQVS